MGHFTAAVVQAATIVGIPTAVTSVELAGFALCARIPAQPSSCPVCALHRQHRRLVREAQGVPQPAGSFLSCQNPNAAVPSSGLQQAWHAVLPT